MQYSTPNLSLNQFIRALRLPFISASVLPYMAGALLDKRSVNYRSLGAGLIAVIMTHLGANLLNDYADSKTGADWKDKKFYGLFGGSKLIQEGIVSERFYLFASGVCFLFAFFSIILLGIMLHDAKVLLYFLAIAFLSFSYSHKPFQFSYHCRGELIILFLFGPVLVMGGYYLQTLLFPTWEGFILGLPFGFFTTAILFSNEVPDFFTDYSAGKMTWVSVFGIRKAYLLYYALIGFGLIGVMGNIIMGTVHPLAWSSLVIIPKAYQAGQILRNSYDDKAKLLISSGITIQIQLLISIILVMGVIL